MAAARAAANQRFGGDCGSIDLPDAAFVPLELAGESASVVAVFLGRGTCVASGEPTLLTGTGGGIVQIWTVRAGVAVQLVDTMMHGLSPTPDGLLAFQHGSLCGDAPGASLCVTTYRWNPGAKTLTAIGQRLYDDAHPGPEPVMRFDWSGARPE